MKEMSFDEFREYIQKEGISEFEVSFDGTESSVTPTHHMYVFVQVVTYCGADDIMSSYRVWNSDEDFILIYKNIMLKTGTGKVRMFIENTGSFRTKDPDDGRELPSTEYGLMKNKKYYAKFSAEQYHLPPDKETGKPRKRTNHVIWISSRAYINGKPQVELTPMYKNWSY